MNIHEHRVCGVKASRGVGGGGGQCRRRRGPGQLGRDVNCLTAGSANDRS